MTAQLSARRTRQLSTRAAKVAAVAAGIEAGPTPGVWYVPSATRPGERYEVAEEGDALTCSCPSGQYRGACVHALAVGARIAEKRAATTRRGEWCPTIADPDTCANCGRTLDEDGDCSYCENTAWEIQHAAGRV